MEGERLIDANEFVKHFWQRVHDGELVTLMDVEHAIINAPTVDAVEVVRCKNCEKRTICRTSTVWAVAPNDDWYCADGKRRTDT